MVPILPDRITELLADRFHAGQFTRPHAAKIVINDSGAESSAVGQGIAKKATSLIVPLSQNLAKPLIFLL